MGTVRDGNCPGINFRDKSITLPILGFIRVISRTSSPSSHSLNKTKLNIMIDNVEIHRVDTNRVSFLRVGSNQY